MTAKRIPTGWQQRELGDISQVRGGKRLPRGERLVSHPTEYPYIRVSDMTPTGIDLSTIQYVPRRIAPQISRYRVRANDLYISVAGTLGLTGKVPRQLDRANLTENADRITGISVDTDYLLHTLRAEATQSQLARIATENARLSRATLAFS